MTDLWPLMALFNCVVIVAALAYWLGYRHGSARRLPPRPEPVREPPFIPAYRVKELTILMELGVLTREEFEQEKVKLHAGRLA
jgi:hypothetical protein